MTLVLDLRRRLATSGAALQAWATLLQGRAAALESDAFRSPSRRSVDQVHKLARALQSAEQPTAEPPLVVAVLPDIGDSSERLLRACRELAREAEELWGRAADPSDAAERRELARRCTRVGDDARRRAGQVTRCVELLGDAAAQLMARSPTTTSHADELHRLARLLAERSRERP